MKRTNTCPKCDSSDVITDAKAIDRVDNGALSVPTFRKPDAAVFSGQLTTTLSACVCADCGYLELYADCLKSIKVPAACTTCGYLLAGLHLCPECGTDVPGHAAHTGGYLTARLSRRAARACGIARLSLACTTRHVTSTKALRSHSSPTVGQEHGGRVTLVEDAMFVRVRAVHLGVGRYPLEGQPVTHLLLHDVSAVRQALLAQACS